MNRIKTHKKIRFTISGTDSRPRLSVYRSNTNLYAQLIDDTAHKTLAHASSLKMKGSLSAKAKLVGEMIAEEAKKIKITEAVFDRGGFKYDGAVKLVAESAREKGLKI